MDCVWAIRLERFVVAQALLYPIEPWCAPAT